MMKIRILALLAVVALTQMAQAQVLRYTDADGAMYETDLNSVDSLVITDINDQTGIKGVMVADPNGAAVEYELGSHVKLTFTPQQLCIVGKDGETAIDLTAGAVLQLTQTTAIRAAQPSAVMRLVGGEVQMDGLKPGQTATLHDMQGRLLTQAKADNAGRISIPVAGQGACIVRTQSVTAKIMAR